MIYRALTSEVNRFLSLPESGMGYQIIQDSRPYRLTNFLVFNAELVITMDSDLNENLRSLNSRGFSQVLNEARSFPVPANSFRQLPISAVDRRTLDLEDSLVTRFHRHKYGTAAKENPTQKATGHEVFVRVSAYENDKRIDFVNKKILPGTYTTTLEDYTWCISTNDDPIDRYALPSNEPIKWAFYVQPLSVDTLKRGVVQPAFGHLGGGIEALFPTGTSIGTYLRKAEYGR